jgi:LPS sulfotransferase NodH
VFDAYFAQRDLIPREQFHELAYESLVADPIGTLRETYEALRLPEFAATEPAMRDYLASIHDYETNRFREVEPPWKEAIARRCLRCFEEWGYAFDFER